MKFKVLRAHYGDRDYAEGDEREASEADVAHLVASGVLKSVRAQSEAKDAGAAPRNKAMGAAPENKAETAPRTRKAE